MLKTVRARITTIAAVSLLLVGSFPAAALEWDLLDRPSRPSLHSLESVRTAVARAGSRLVSVGEAGIVLLSDDNGKTWHQAKVPVSVLLTNVFFRSPMLGWAVGHGGVVLTTQDAGETWTKQLDGKMAAQIELEDAERAAAGSSTPALTHRLGEAKGLVTDGADKPFLGLYFFDDKRGMVVGAYGLAFTTDDGGQTWRSSIGNIENPKRRHLYAILPTENAVFIVGEEGDIYRSTDGGKSFAALAKASPGTLFGAAQAANGTIVVFGLRGNAYRSSDAGNSWQKIELPTSGLNAGIRLADGSLVLVDDWGEILRSTDGGLSFKSAAPAQPMGLLGVVEAADGSLALAGTAGNARIVLNGKSAEQTK